VLTPFRQSAATALAVFIAAGLSSASTISLTGTLPTPENQVNYTFSLATAGDLTFQTYGLGGGTNAAGTIIPAGGFDPFVALFSGSADNAALLDGTGRQPEQLRHGTLGMPSGWISDDRHRGRSMRRRSTPVHGPRRRYL
jgi:hypothetical protein